MGRSRPRTTSVRRPFRLVRSLSLAALGSVVVFSAASAALAPAASAAETARSTTTTTSAPAPTTRPLGLTIANTRTGDPVTGAGYHLCAQSAGAPAGAVCPAGTADVSASRSNEDGRVVFPKKFPGGHYLAVQAASPYGYVPDAATHVLDVPPVTTTTDAATTFYVPVDLSPKAPGLIADKIKTWQGKTGSTNVLRNDNPILGTLRLIGVTGAKHGTVTWTASGVVTYRPAAGFTGSDTLHYSAANLLGGSATNGVVAVKVWPVLAPAPTAKPVHLSGSVNATLSFDPLANASAADGEQLALRAITQPGHGQTYVKGGRIYYVPNRGYAGTDAFNYTVITSNGRCDTNRVTVEMRPVPIEVKGFLPVTGGPTDVSRAALVGLGCLGLGIALLAAGALPWRRGGTAAEAGGQTA